MFYLSLANWQFPVFASAPGSKCLLGFCANATRGQRLPGCVQGDSYHRWGPEKILSPCLRSDTEPFPAPLASRLENLDPQTEQNYLN